MEIATSATPHGLPPYPYFKAVIVGDWAEIAALPCDSFETENIVFHEDLLSRLHEKQPELADRPFTAARLTLSDTEAFLYIAAGTPVTQEDVERIGRAIGGWCETHGVTKLTISDTSRTSGEASASDEVWDFEDWIASA